MALHLHGAALPTEKKVISMVATLQREAEKLYSQDSIPEEFGWIVWLSPGNQRLFAGELYAALQRKASDDEFSEMVDAWKATAELEHDVQAKSRIEQNRQSSQWASADQWMSRFRSTASSSGISTST